MFRIDDTKTFIANTMETLHPANIDKKAPVSAQKIFFLQSRFNF